ncbi:MAG: hypothetical protein H6739_28130 [Alphaproteobacteria bacterium]|nr:hypothetical protein [Alphaproteobacteria bacterium]
MFAALTLTLLTNPALAGAIEVLPAGPLIADGETTVMVPLRIPGLAPEDKLRIRPEEGEISAVSRGPEGLVVLHFVPPEIYRADTARMRISIRGTMKLDEDISIDLLPLPHAELSLDFEPSDWTAGQKGTVTVTVSSDGPHPLPASARVYALSVTEGTLSEPTRTDDGRWTANWTPPSKLDTPTNVLFTATDQTTPGAVRGLATFPVLVEKPQTVAAPSGSMNTLVIGQNQYGPVTAGDDGSVTFNARLDPRVQTGTLQSVDNTARRTDSTVNLELGSPVQLNFAPLPPNLPTNTPLTLWLAVTQPDGRGWASTAPRLATGEEGKNEGGGWFSFSVTTPSDPGAWSLTAKAGEDETTLTVDVVDAVPDLTLSADPASLGEKDRDFTVTVGLKDGAGKALTKRKLDFTADGAAPVGSTKDNGDGTYTQRYRLGTKDEVAVVRALPALQATGLPPAQLVVWPLDGSVPADGSSELDIRIVALDALGMPVPDVTLSFTAPVGDGVIRPEAKTDKHGMASIPYRAGGIVGPVVVRVDASGLQGDTMFVQTAVGAEPAQVDPVGRADIVEAIAEWRQSSPQVRVGRAGADVGPAAVVTLNTVPSYTTPGAAILVTLQVLDSQGHPVINTLPVITATPGTVGALTNNGDGSYSVPVQLPPGVDGPLKIQVGADAATGMLILPTLAQMTAANIDSGGGGGGGGRDRSGGGGGGLSLGGGGDDEPSALRVRAGLMDMAYSHYGFYSDAGLLGGICVDGVGFLPPDDSLLPCSVYFKQSFPVGALGLGLQATYFPNNGMIGMDLNTRAGLYRVQIGNENYVDGVLPTTLAARVRFKIVMPTLHFYLTGGAGISDAVILSYGDLSKATADLSNKWIIGGRVGFGMDWQWRRFYYEFEVAETFAPLPALTQIRLGVDVDLTEVGGMPLFLHGSYWQDRQHRKMSAGDEEYVRVLAGQSTLLIGAGIRL